MNFDLAKCAEEQVLKEYHGNIGELKTNLKPIADLFNYSKEWSLDS